ncbi:MAG: hypothetical protein IJL53_10915 [Firmicutes bacterium]|nr:hypothetical protein [Bacillota bacterium]
MNENAVPVESGEIEINVLSLIKELIRKWYIIAAAAICCAILMIVYTFISADRRYTSTASAYLLSKTDRSTAITTAELSASATLAADFVQILGSTDTLQETINRLELQVPVSTLRSAVSISNISGNRVVTLSIKDNDAAQAQKIGETMLAVAGEKAASISQTLYIEVVDKPSLPSVVSKPGFKSPFVKGFLLGFIIACAYVLVRWFIRKPICDEEDVKDYFKVPSLGSITADKR